MTDVTDGVRFARRLRAGENAAIVELRAAFAVNPSPTVVADLVGFKRVSTLWRIASDVPAVRSVIDECGARRGGPRVCKKGESNG